MKKYCAALLVMSIILVGCSTAKKSKSTTTTTTAKKTSQGEVNFTSCGDLDCAKISVPMNYKNPDGRKIKIALAKMSAADPQKRIGILLINPGGPGASGIELLESSAGFIFSQDILDRFDIIGWDPRGVGDSTHVECATSLDFLFDDTDYSPDDDDELKKLKAANKQLGQKCAKEDAELLPFLSTENSVQDMDSIREQLGEDQINYLGFSYGTALGQLYAHKYPKNFRTMVLDGVIDMGADPEQIAIEQTLGFEDALNSFFTFCRTTSCSFAKGKDPKEAFISILNQIDKKSMVSEADSSQVLGPAQLDIGTALYLYSGEFGWRSLNAALNAVTNGDPEDMIFAFSAYVGRDDSGKYDGSYAAFLAIGCADGKLGDVDALQDLAESMKAKAPVFGESGIYLGLPCATWPKSPQSKSFDVDATGSAPIVVIGTTGDPATPVQWARNASKQLKTGVYIERVGEGHTAYGQGSDCIDKIVEDYLVSATAPTAQVCS